MLVTLLAKQGAVVIGHEISHGDYWCRFSLLCLAVYLHGASQLTPDYLEYPLSNLFRKLNLWWNLKAQPLGKGLDNQESRVSWIWSLRFVSHLFISKWVLVRMLVKLNLTSSVKHLVLD